MVRWQAFRRVIEQPYDFYQNDFAGRIATKIMQGGEAVGDFIVNVLQTMWSFLTFVVLAISILVAARSADGWSSSRLVRGLRGHRPVPAAGDARCRAATADGARSSTAAWSTPSPTSWRSSCSTAGGASMPTSATGWTCLSTAVMRPDARHHHGARRGGDAQRRHDGARSRRRVHRWMEGGGITDRRHRRRARPGVPAEPDVRLDDVQHQRLIRNFATVQDATGVDLGASRAIRDADDAAETRARERAISASRTSPSITARAAASSTGFASTSGRASAWRWSARRAPARPRSSIWRSGYSISRRPHPDRRADIRKLTQASLRAQFGVVSQEPLLMHRSIRDNIAYGKPGASEAEIIARRQTRFGARLHPQRRAIRRAARATTPMSASAASSFPAASASASRSPA